MIEEYQKRSVEGETNVYHEGVAGTELIKTSYSWDVVIVLRKIFVCELEGEVAFGECTGLVDLFVLRKVRVESEVISDVDDQTNEAFIAKITSAN